MGEAPIAQRTIEVIPCDLIVGELDAALLRERHALQGELHAEVTARHHQFMIVDFLQQACGLEVEIVPGGPQVNNRALMLAGLVLGLWIFPGPRKVGPVGLDVHTLLYAAAAVAVAEDWPDRAIAALGDSGDRRWYDWRFPSPHIELVRENAAANGLAPAWVMGLMRSESALAEDAISHAGARGLMQITPGTASRLARKHGVAYRGRAALLEPQVNVQLGTAYLRDLLERFDGNPVLATGAYNAGPGAVDRWIGDGYTGDAAVWIDSLPYFETRDYIPRVLAFTTIYEWRLGLPVQRVSARMPAVGVSGPVAPLLASSRVGVACTAGE